MSLENHATMRSKIPNDLASWRVPGPRYEDEERLWDVFRGLFNRAGIKLWRAAAGSPFQVPCADFQSLASGFAYFVPARSANWFGRESEFNSKNAMCRGATTGDGHTVVVRVIVIRDEGKQHLNILRKIGQGLPSLLTTNHAVPLWREVHFEDIVFGIFPFIGGSVQSCFDPYLRNSVGDVVDMILQCLEALAFIHSLGIAHRDTDKSNFLVQYQPESLITMRVPLTRPRVYLNDFEYAIDFGNPAATTDLGPAEGYLRQLAPEVYLGKQYDPFKADVWQFGYSFSNFVSTIPAIDEILDNIVSPDAAVRPTAAEARDQLALVVHSMLPTALLICPVVFERGQWQTVEAWAKSIYGS